MSEEVKVVSLPLADPFDIPENVVVDLHSATFSQDFDENIVTSFIYLRNIEYNGSIDFSKFSKDEKMRILKLYMERDLKDFNLKQLDYTIFYLFADFKKDNDIDFLLDEDERQEFKTANKELCDEMLQFIVSLPVYILSLDKDILNCELGEIKHIDSIPKTYECILMLFKYVELNVLMLLPTLYADVPECVFFDKVFKYENSQLADAVQKTTFSYLYNGMLNEAANSQGILQQEQ